MVAYRFHSLEADGPWTSPTFTPAEKRHIVQGVIAGYIMGRPRWAEDTFGNFIFGLDAKGKEMMSAPRAPTPPTPPRRRGKNKPKTTAQLERGRKQALSERVDTALLASLENRRADPYGEARGTPWENPKTPAELDREIAQVLARRKK